MKTGDKVLVGGIGEGVIVEFHPQDMVDVDMGEGLVVRKHVASLISTREVRPNPALTTDELREIAQIIRKQIGTEPLMWLGAHDFTFGLLSDESGKSHPGLQFSVKGTKVKVGGRVRVLYDTGADTYIVFVFRVRKYEAITVKQVDDVYGAQLSSAIEGIVG